MSDNEGCIVRGCAPALAALILLLALLVRR